VINNPKGAYYGALVSGPVFRDVADKVYASDAQMYDPLKNQTFVGAVKKPAVKSGQSKATQSVYRSFGMKSNVMSKGEYVSSTDSTGKIEREIKYTEGRVPDVNGMGLKDALYLLGNSGLRPLVKGSGKVVRQSLAAGLRVAKGYQIVLELE